MFRQLLQKVLVFSKLYEEKQDLSLLTNCENVPEYKEVLKTLNKFTLKDLKLDEKTIAESFIPGCVTAATIIESPMISLGYFFIPAGMTLSPHDHPGMLVTSKILKGSVKRRAWDLVDREKQFELPLNPSFDIEDNPYTGTRLEAILDTDELCEEGEMINLTPLRGNVHAFIAEEDTIIFDVFTPYYDQETRFCNFYLEVDNTKPNFKSKLVKKLKKETSEQDRTKKGFKSTLAYLYEPPKIEFKVVPCSDKLLGEDEEGKENTENTEKKIE